MLIPSHAQRTALAWIDEVVYCFVVDLDEGEKNTESSFSLLLFINEFEGISDRSWDDALSCFIISSLDGIGLA